MVKIAEVWTNLLSAGRPFAIKAAKATAKVRSTTFPPTTSPKESWGILRRAEEIPRKRLGKLAAKAITMKAATNSFHPKKRAILIKLSIINLPDQKSKKTEPRKRKICKRRGGICFADYDYL